MARIKEGRKGKMDERSKMDQIKGAGNWPGTVAALTLKAFVPKKYFLIFVLMVIICPSVFFHVAALQRFHKHRNERSNELAILYRCTSIQLSIRLYYQFPAYSTSLLVTYLAQGMKFRLFLQTDGRFRLVTEHMFWTLLPLVKGAQRDPRPSLCLAFSSGVTHDRPTLQTC